MRHLLNNIEIHCSNDYQYHINDRELQTSANHIAISRIRVFTDLQVVWSAKKGNSTSKVFKFKYMFIFHYIFLVLSFVNVLVLNKLSKEGITSKIQSITIFTEIVTFSFVDFHLIWSTKMSSRILKIKIKETARLKDKIHVFCFLYRVFVSLFKNSFTRFFDSLPCKNPRKIHICK